MLSGTGLQPLLSAGQGTGRVQSVLLCAAPLLRADARCVQISDFVQGLLCAAPLFHAKPTVCRTPLACNAYCVRPLSCVQTPAVCDPFLACKACCVQSRTYLQGLPGAAPLLCADVSCVQIPVFVPG